LQHPSGTKSRNNGEKRKDWVSTFAKSGNNSFSKERQPISRENKSKVNNQTVKASSSNHLQKPNQIRSEEINIKIKVDPKFKSRGELLIVCPRVTKTFINSLKSITLSKETLIRLNLDEDAKNVKNHSTEKANLDSNSEGPMSTSKDAKGTGNVKNCPTGKANLDSNSKSPMPTAKEAKAPKKNSSRGQKKQVSLNDEQDLPGVNSTSVNGDNETEITDEEPSIRRKTDPGVKSGGKPDTIEREKSKNTSLKIQQQQQREKELFESPKLPSTSTQSPSRSSTLSVLKKPRVLFSHEEANNNEQIRGKQREDLRKSTTLKLATPTSLLTRPNTSFSKQKNILNESGRETPTINGITEEMLNNVSLCVTEKVFCLEKGSACHHCCIKSLDTKTICRSGRCEGEQGQFCGPCLTGFYGEDPREALRDPTWVCPPCRDICRCSVCQNREDTNGRILSTQSLSKGFASVTKFLTNMIENY